MGFLLDLIRRWAGGPSNRPGRSVAPSPTAADTTGQPAEPEPIVEPEPAVEPEPEPVVEPEPIRPPRPIGLDGDLAAPMAFGAADRPAVKADPASARAVGPRPGLDANNHADRPDDDILYLGRGVSRGLGDRRSDLDRLRLGGLPALGGPRDVADWLGLSASRLRWLAFHAEVADRTHYVSFDVPKRSGGTRRLSAPHRTLAEAQRRILDEVVSRLPAEPEAHGFEPGRSIVTNARPHARKAVVVNLDLADFFPSVGFHRVKGVFERAGYSPAASTVLALLCTECPRRPATFEGRPVMVATGPRGLPQGACTSPGLSNRVAARLDRRLAGLARSMNAAYTRYADDMTFSGDRDLDQQVGRLLGAARRIARSEGFVVNEAKTRVLRPNAAQVVTGLVVNDRLGVPRDEIRRLRAILHRARLEGLEAQNRESHPHFRAHLVGKIAFIRMSRPEVADRLMLDLEALGPPG